MTLSHEQQIHKFLSSKGIAKEYLNYDNFATYADAKRFSKHHVTSERDKKQLHKFCKRWVVFRGDVKANALTKIAKILSVCKKREHNYLCKQRRLETRPVVNKKQRKVGLSKPQ